MRLSKHHAAAVTAILLIALSGCSGGSFPGGRSNLSPEERQARIAAAEQQRPIVEKRSTIWDLFKNNETPNTTVNVSKYIWTASLEVLDFLPIQAADPFTGVIVTGYGTPPGGGRAYRATIYIQDPALDARSLRIAMQTRGGTVSPQTVRAIEDAILTRARQLRAGDRKL